MRGIMIDVVRRVAEEIFIPFSVGGGIRTIDDMRNILLAGAEKVSVNTAAVLNPAMISDGAEAFGSQDIVLGMDVKKVKATNTITPLLFSLRSHPRILEILASSQQRYILKQITNSREKNKKYTKKCFTNP